MNIKAEEAFRKENERQGVTGAAKDPGAELRELSDEELDRVAGGGLMGYCHTDCRYNYYKNRCDC